MFQGLWDVLNKYKAELVVDYFVVDEENYFLRRQATEISPAPCGASQSLWREHGKWSKRVDSRVLGDAKNRVTFVVNVPSGGALFFNPWLFTEMIDAVIFLGRVYYPSLEEKCEHVGIGRRTGCTIRLCLVVSGT